MLERVLAFRMRFAVLALVCLGTLAASRGGVAGEAAFPVGGAIDGAGWWAARVSLPAGELSATLRVDGVLRDADRGVVLAGLVDASGTVVGEWSLVGSQEALAGSVSASVLEPVRVGVPGPGSGRGSTVEALLVFPVAGGEFTFVVAAAAESDGVRVSVSLASGAGSALAVASGAEAFVLGESAFQCALGASASAPGSSALAAGGARASALWGCHRQAQVRESLFTVFRAREGEAGVPSQFLLLDPAGTAFAPQDGSVRVLAGVHGVWDYRLDLHAGAGAGGGAPDVAALVADVRMP